ncbi:hypothetical protein DL764_008673 [Monosporascus ibericus]|uniref:Aminoglycoside phosphotransferase domain-containing protein n=1 Tax=Monosporascus ibericus TaxID=155417 RepID=A0A4Q4T0B2_9PEZI|nr:hypothetical protein DL764_008673 [Monosporascus ibericus]
MSAAEHSDGNSEASEDSTSPEDLSLTPEHSPSLRLGRASSVTDDGAQPQDENEVPESEQPNMPYIKTLEELYRIVDSIARSSTIDVRHIRESATATKAAVDYDDNDDGYDFYDIAEDVRDLICLACATPYEQAADSAPFRTSLRLRYNDPAGQTWAVGDRLVLTETTEDSQPEGPEVAAAEAARMLLGRRTAGPVPVPAVLAAWKERGRVITIAERPRGRRLYDVWWELGPGDRESLAARVAGYVEQWRRNRSDAISSISGYRVRGHDRLLGCGGGDEEDGFWPCYSDVQFWGVVRDRLRRHDHKIEEDVIRFLGDYMPESYPCVLTHGDLSTRNIIVEMDAEEARVTAILGFENAASLPVWAESVCARFCYCGEDEQWKALLAQHLRADPLALDWWCLWTELEDTAPDAARVEILKERCRRWPKPPPERRSFNDSGTEPRREPLGAKGVKVPGESVSYGDGGDYTREAVGAERPIFNSEPIQFSDPEATDSEDYDDDDDNSSLGGLRETNIYGTSKDSQKQHQVNDKQEPDEQKETKRKGLYKEEKNGLKGEKNTWHTSRPTRAGELQSNVLGPGTFTRTGRSPGHSPGDANTRPYKPIIPPGIGDLDQRFRGRTMGRISGRESQPLSSNNKRSSMRSFDQRTPQPFTLQLPTTGSRGRPYSSPVIPASDMERLRKIGEDDKDCIVTGVPEPEKGIDAAGDKPSGSVALPTT